MKKVLIFVLAIVTMLILAACGQQKAVPEKEKPMETTAPGVLIEDTWPVSDLSAEPSAEPVETPIKTTLAVHEIAEGTYTGMLSGDSYTVTGKSDPYTISTDIPSAEIAVIIRDGQLRLYCAAVARAAGTVAGATAPRSPTSTRVVSGTLPLSQTDADTVSAGGELTAQEEGLRINWDGNMRFTVWEAPMRESTYTCTALITLADGVPTAAITVDGSDSHRTATVPLCLAAQGGPDAETAHVLWSNAGPGDARQGARDYYVMFPLPDCLVTELVTDHRMSGGKEPGQLMLFSEDGSEYGPFDATGREGADGTANAYWVAAVNIDLPAGRYAVADSDEATWSCNDETDGWGMATVRGILR